MAVFFRDRSLQPGMSYWTERLRRSCTRLPLLTEGRGAISSQHARARAELAMGLDFVCNVCGTAVADCPLDVIGREVPSCPSCGSTVRFRSIVHLLSLALFERSMPLVEFPRDRSIVGLGLSDWNGYAGPLSKKFSYSNTYFHVPPYLDISQPVDDRAGTCDFLISTEVFEHVAPPVSRAFRHAFDLLKPGGHLVLTVPFTNGPETAEHFPELHDYRIIQFDDDYVMVNRSAHGRYTLHEKLRFHGGPGTTLEMRVFCRADLIQQLSAAGFGTIRVMDEDAPQWGILHKEPWSLPVLAQRPID
jgi:SAM-dependent methyltransferase